MDGLAPAVGPAADLAPAFWQQTLQQQDAQQRLATNVFRGVSVIDHSPSPFQTKAKNVGTFLRGHVAMTMPQKPECPRPCMDGRRAGGLRRGLDPRQRHRRHGSRRRYRWWLRVGATRRGDRQREHAPPDERSTRPPAPMRRTTGRSIGRHDSACGEQRRGADRAPPGRRPNRARPSTPRGSRTAVG